jgi:ABC-2 type transport system ATP-binding protein
MTPDHLVRARVAGPPRAPEAGAPILFEDVHRRFGDKEVLRGLSLVVRPGEIVALLGRNGCGKTTALRILLGFLAPHRGRACILGADSRRLAPRDRGRIGYVSEDHRLYRGLRLDEVIAFEAGTRDVFDTGEARAALARCGLGLATRVGELSRGQRAQVALIVAVASHPEVLVLDDPALGLDAVVRRELLDVMIDLLADRGLSVLFSTHILTDVERVADRVSLLDGGRLLVDAPLDDLKRRVQKRRLRRPGRLDLPPTAAPGLLRAHRARDGWDVLLLDADTRTEGALRAEGWILGEPLPVDLEELFVVLTRAEGERLRAPPAAEPEPSLHGEGR